MALTVSQGQALAEKILDWLDASGQGAPDGELLEFVDDLENARNTSTWAGVNFERILPLRVPLAANVRRATIIRNAVIFLPIILTWLALEHAASSFSSRTDGVNFLTHWQTIGGYFSLQVIAWIDAILIGSVVLLTVAVGLLEENDTTRRRIEQQHSGLMVALERELSGYRYLSIQDINLAASGTLQSLLASSAEVERAASSFAESAALAQAFVSEAQGAVKGMFEPTVSRLDAVITSLGRAAGVHDDLTKVVEHAQDNLRSYVEDLNKNFTGMLVALEKQVSRILVDIEGRLAGAGQQVGATLSKGMTDLSTAAQTVATGLAGQSSQQIAGLASGIKAAADSMQRAATGLEGVQKDLERVTNLVMVNAATMADDLERIHLRLQQVAR